MAIIKNDDYHFDHYISRGATLEFKCKRHWQSRVEDNMGELQGYSQDYHETNDVVHIRVSGGSITLEKVKALLPSLYTTAPSDQTLSYYTDFEFVRAFRTDNEVVLS